MPLTDAELDAAFMALADPTRRGIVARLTRGDATVTELAETSGLTLPGFSKHLKVLERSGLISRSRRAQFRPCHLEWAALDEAVGWIEANRRLWSQRFDKLDAHLREVQRSGPAGADPALAGPANADAAPAVAAPADRAPADRAPADGAPGRPATAESATAESATAERASDD
jgi:DNA-binding transcriptional ArsR family regulator